MELSSRARLCPPSPIRKLVPIAERVKKAGIKIYHLNIGQPDLPTPRIFWDTIHNYPSQTLAYGNSQGETPLREAFSKYYKSFCDIELTADDMVITTGGSEAIAFAMMVVANPGDNFIIFEPFYTNYNGDSCIAGTMLKPLTTKAEDGYHLPPAEDIEKLIDDRTRAIVICSPNNPTGTILTPREMETIARIALKHDLFVISDEVYREFAYETKPLSIMHFSELSQHAILVDSVSKRFSACGARVGVIASRNTDVIDSALRFGQARLCPPRLEQEGILAILKNLSQEYFDQLREEYRRRRDVAIEELQRIEGTFLIPPEGAFYLMVKLPVRDTDNFARWMLESFALDNETVMVAPGAGFYATRGLGEDEVRIAYVLAERELRKGIRLLGRALADYREKGLD